MAISVRRKATYTGVVLLNSSLWLSLVGAVWLAA